MTTTSMRGIRSSSRARCGVFTSAFKFKELEAVPAFRATAKLADFLKGVS